MIIRREILEAQRRERGSSVQRAWKALPLRQRPPAGLGIGIITYNRLPTLQLCVNAVERNTKAPFHMVVADDGSTDGSSAWARECHIPVVTGRHQGCAWNKNRALYYLLHNTRCDPILLLEDDCLPHQIGWEQAWIEAAYRWYHVNFMTPFIQEFFYLGGNGTPEDPYRSSHLSAQCTISTRQALDQVGYLDTRFEGWGEEHVEWSHRFWRINHSRYAALESKGNHNGNHKATVSHSVGVESQPQPAILETPVFVSLRHGLALAEAGTYKDMEILRRNVEIRQTIALDPLPRDPYRDQREYQQLMREQTRAQWPLKPQEGVPGVISVICPTRTPSLAQRMQESLQGADCEIVWVWNGEGECPLHGQSVKYDADSFHYEEAINLGVQHSEGSILFIVNDDVELTCSGPELFQHLREIYAQAPQLGACYGNWAGPWQVFEDAEAPEWEGCCWAVSRRAFQAMGGLEESIVEYGGDELMTRARMRRLAFPGARLKGWTYSHLRHGTYGPGAFNLKHISQVAAALGWKGIPEQIPAREARRVCDLLWKRDKEPVRGFYIDHEVS